jgi:sec-independent protein translocase protein TatA
VPSWIGLPEILILLLVALLIFGPKRLPEMGRSLGRGMREFKDSISGGGRSRDEDDRFELPSADDERTTRPTPRERDTVG